MTLKVKKDGAWKEASSLKVKIAGEWKDISTLYSKKDGAWVAVYSSGALIEFNDYPFPIPVAQGWKYSTDGKTWTKVEADGEINTDGGMFTGFVKASEITLSDYATENVPGGSGRLDGQTLGTKRESSVSFSNERRGYICGGYNGSVLDTVEVYDSSGNRTDGTALSSSRRISTAFSNSGKGYVCGGQKSNTYSCNNVDIYDANGTRTIGTSLNYPRSRLTSFVNDSKGYVCGGYENDGGADCSDVDIYDSSGNRTTGTNLSNYRSYLTSFTNGNKGYVCGGLYSSSNHRSTVDVYDSSGNRTTGTSLSVARSKLTSFVNDSKGYVCGGETTSSNWSDVVDVYDIDGNRTTGMSMSSKRSNFTSFVISSKGYVCGGFSNIMSDSYYSKVDVYDSSGNRTTGVPLSSAKCDLTSFINDNKGYVCGGQTSSDYSATVDIYYDQPEILYTKLPVTAGSSYTLNGESGVASKSTIMEFDSKVSGIIKYKKGGILTDVVLIEYLDYPYPIPVASGWKYSTGGSDWNEVTVDGEINTEGGTFTGSVWANSLMLSEYCTEYTPEQIGARMDGTKMGTARADGASFANGSYGFICAGRGNSSYSTVEMRDTHDNRTFGNSLSSSKSLVSSFVNNSKGYICGGSTGNATSEVDVLDSSGIRTTGTRLPGVRQESTAFTNGGYGFVCGGRTTTGWSSDYMSGTIFIYDSSGNVTTSNSSLFSNVFSPGSFVNGGYGFVYSGHTGNGVSWDVNRINANGVRSSAENLNKSHWHASSFVNDSKGYICGGDASGSPYLDSVVIYDTRGVKTTGESLSVGRTEATSFTIGSHGYVCGGKISNGVKDVVDVYDVSGIRTTGESLSVGRYNSMSFVNGSKGYVCSGGTNSNNIYASVISDVDIYYDIPEATHTKLPITEGSTYTLNGESGVADVSKVMEFDSKVTGTINYTKGDLYPGVKVTVVDENGDVVSGADITIEGV